MPLIKRFFYHQIQVDGICEQILKWFRRQAFRNGLDFLSIFHDFRDKFPFLRLTCSACRLWSSKFDSKNVLELRLLFRRLFWRDTRIIFKWVFEHFTYHVNVVNNDEKQEWNEVQIDFIFHEELKSISCVSMIVMDR